MKFLHVTDLHMVAAGLLYGLDPAERLAACIADMMAHHADAAFVVVTGDLAHKGDEGAYRRLRGLLAELRLPTHLMLGNHDSRPAFQAVFADAPRDGAGFVQYAFDTEIGRCVCLDTHTADGHHGELDPERLDWLRGEIARADARGITLFMHHPPMPVGIRRMDRIALRDSDRLAELLRGTDKVRHLFFGHLHRPLSGTWHGIPFTGLPALNHQVALDFAIEDAVSGSHEPPAYGVVLADRQTTVVHVHHFLDRTNTFNL